MNSDRLVSAEKKPVKSASSHEEETFISRLVELGKVDRGAIARFKRNVSASIAESKGVMTLFYSLLPRSKGTQHDEEIFFLVATLWAMTFKEQRPPAPQRPRNDFGETMRRVRNDPSVSPEAIDRRMTILLDGEFSTLENGYPCGGELPYRVRQCVKIANSKEKGVDWPQLLRDLRRWNNPQKWVQKQWTRTYFGARPIEVPKVDDKLENSPETNHKSPNGSNPALKPEKKGTKSPSRIKEVSQLKK